MKTEVTALICYGNSTISKLISLFTKSKITHVAFKIVLDGHIFIAESQKNGFNLKTYETWIKQFGYKYDEYEIPAIYKDVDKNIYDHLSTTPYDFRLFILRYPKHIISKIFGNKKEIESVKNEDETEICSESFAHCLRWVDPHKYLPVDCCERIKKECWNKKEKL